MDKLRLAAVLLCLACTVPFAAGAVGPTNVDPAPTEIVATAPETVETSEAPATDPAAPTETPDAAPADAAPVDDAAPTEEPAAETADPTEPETPRTPPALETTEHRTFVSGRGEARFAPNASVTRAETCAMLVSLLAEAPEGTQSAAFSDVAAGDWYHDAVAALSELGIVGGYADGTFAPNKTITRAEFVTILSRFYPLTESDAAFPDVPADHWARAAIVSAAAKGWVHGYEDGSFGPDRTITRAEAVTVLDAVLGRSAKAAQTQERIAAAHVGLFTDVAPTDWYYAAVMEAAQPHSYETIDGQEVWTDLTYRSCGYAPGLQQVGAALRMIDENGQLQALTPGFLTIGEKEYYVAADGSIPFTGAGPQAIDGALYCLAEDGSVLRDATWGSLSFGPDGRYSSGNAVLDEQVAQALAQCVTDGMSQSEKLRASYLYLRDNCTYLPRAHHPRGSTDWTEESASFLFANHKGNCYAYAAAFLYMARQLGYDAQPVSGGSGARDSDHAWVMIGGRIFDPELEYAYLYRVAPSIRHYYDLYDLDPAASPILYHFPS